MSEWKQYKLGDISDITSSKRIFYSDYVSEGIPFFRSKEIIERSLGESGGEALFISRDKYFEIKAKFGAPVNGDLLISAVGERAGIPYVVNNQGDFYFKDGNLIWLRNFKPELNSTYLNYWIKSYEGQHTLENIMIGSAQKALTIIGLKTLVVTLPSTLYQRKVVEILSSLDDKIDLLHRQNKTLEQLAETLFRQWFVEEAGEDWETGSLGDVMEFNYGKTLRDQERSGTGFPVYGSSGIVGYHSDFVVEGPGIITGRKGTLGVINYSFDNFYPIDTTFYITSKVDSRGLFYEYFLLKTLNLFEMNSDSAVPGLNRTLAHGMQIKIPSFRLVNEFNNIAHVQFQKIKSNINQIHTLTLLRDNLLPKLMSGEVRVEL